MKRLLPLVVLFLVVASGAWNAEPPRAALEVYDIHWECGWPDPYFPDRANHYPAGKLRNNSKITYEFILITCSVIERKTGEKVQIKPVALIENVQPGDKCQWKAYPGYEMRIGDSGQYLIRIDKVEPYNSPK